VDTGKVVARDDDPRVAELLSQGWHVIAESWAAQLDAHAIDTRELSRLAATAGPYGGVRSAESSDVSAILALDAVTLPHYPGDVATHHEALTPVSAGLSATRRAFGVFEHERALAVTYVDLAGHRAEIDFTVVTPELRGRRLGSAVKAASVLALSAEGVRTFRTGGSAENHAILAANGRLGFVVDERWVTLAAPTTAP